MPLILGPTPPYAANPFGTMILQVRLNNLAAHRTLDHLEAWGSHAIDGNYDLATFLNVCAVQHLSTITVDGIYGPQTDAAMRAMEAYYGIVY